MDKRALTYLIAVAGLSGLATGQTPPAEAADPPPAETAPATTAPDQETETAETARTDDGETRTNVIRRLGTLGPLLEELDRLTETVQALRAQLAETRMEAATARQELEEMRQFLADHHQYGTDFEQYRAVKQAAGRDARTKQMQDRVAELERKRAERKERQKEARASRAEARAEEERLSFYRRRGFTGIGLDVFLSRMAYNYPSVDRTRSRFDWSPGVGRYLRYYPAVGIDFSTMTFSGSVLNATDSPRNIGIAVTFFDEHGNQVGQETVQVNNARPDVPYPFTAEVRMALDRPFASSSQYVLYADPVAAGVTAAP